MLVRKEQSFFGATQKEAEASAAPFVVSTNGKIFFSAPVARLPIGDNDWKRPHQWQVDVEYYEEASERPDSEFAT
jgi:hypothetical protein